MGGFLFTAFADKKPFTKEETMTTHRVMVMDSYLIGKRGSQRTIHPLSNGRWIEEDTRRQRGDRYWLYKKGVNVNNPNPSGVERKSKKLQDLVDYVNQKGD